MWISRSALVWRGFVGGGGLSMMLKAIVGLSTRERQSELICTSEVPDRIR